MSDTDGNAPTVFVSSTNIDLEDFRKEAAMAGHAAGYLADLQENWTAEDPPPLNTCLERVGKADAPLVIVAHRYGWVPEDEKHNPEGRSITWLECEQAAWPRANTSSLLWSTMMPMFSSRRTASGPRG